MQRQSQTSETIRAHVVLKGPAGSPVSAKSVSAENIQAYVSDPSVGEQVRSALEKMGFSVRRVSPLSINHRSRSRTVGERVSWTTQKDRIVRASLRQAERL
jgi:hypothetical protein